MTAKTNAERVAAHRARQKQSVSLDQQRQDYIDREVAITQAQVDRGLIKTQCVQEGKILKLDPVGRTRAYAEWRWDGVQSGEVSTL